MEESLPQIVFVTGAPRSGTTYVSDWITQTTDSYCAHEVLKALLRLDDSQIVSRLQNFADTAADRSSFPRDHSATLKHTCPRVLGFKEPITWSFAAPSIPYPVSGFLENTHAKSLVLIRHPFDVIASGKHRAAHTNNWPNFTVEQHCNFWCESIYAGSGAAWANVDVMPIRWERLVMEYETVRSEIDAFLNISLPIFFGYGTQQKAHESVSEAIRESKASLEDGLATNSKRSLLTAADKEIIRSVTGDLCDQLHYNLT